MKDVIAIGGDHAGYSYKEQLIQVLKTKGYKLKDFGPFSDASVDYPDFIHPLCKEVGTEVIKRGIIICGSGNGVAITANKHAHIRAAICWNVELAALARQHNDANVLAIPARFVDFDLVIQMVDTFLTTEFEGGRHQRRVDKISECG